MEKNIEWYKLAITLHKYHTFISRVVNLSYFIYLHTTPLLMIKPILKYYLNSISNLVLSYSITHYIIQFL